MEEKALNIVWMSEIAPESVRWLWPPYIPMGMMSIVEGDPGAGKSTLTIALAAAVSRGGMMNGHGVPQGNVLMLGNEDSLSVTVRPRLDAAGADCTKVAVVDQALTFDEKGARLLSAAVEKVEPKLIIVDPIQSFLGGNTDMYRANQVRVVLDRLSVVTEASGAACIIVRHLRKAGGSAIYRGMGSIDFVAKVRSSLLVGADGDGQRIVAHSKCNIGALGPSLGFVIDEGEFAWRGEIPTSADEMTMEMDIDQRDARRSAKMVVMEFLGDGEWHKSTELATYAKSQGVSARSVTSARGVLGVEREKRSEEWWCRLPKR